MLVEDQRVTHSLNLAVLDECGVVSHGDLCWFDRFRKLRSKMVYDIKAEVTQERLGPVRGEMEIPLPVESGIAKNTLALCG